MKGSAQACPAMNCGATLLPLEDRVLLAAPTFATEPTNLTFGANGAVVLPVNGFDLDGDTLTITATSTNPNFILSVPTGDTFAVMHYTDGAGVPLGDIVIQLFTSRPYASAAAQQFITLATNFVNPDGTLNPAGTPFYTDVAVHRVVDGFMFQSGDAANSDGTGSSPLDNVPDNFDPFLSFAAPGMLAMANSNNATQGRYDTSNSQWFITDAATAFLDNKYVIFGQMISGQAAFEAIMATPVHVNSSGENSQPDSAPILTGIDILDASDAIARQNGVLIIQPRNNYAGSGQVTITVSDGTTIAMRTITVNALGINDPGPQVVAGTSVTFDADVFAAGGSATLTAVAATIPGVSASVQPGTHLVTVTLPSGYVGAFPVTLTAAFPDDVTVSRTFYVTAGGSPAVEFLGGLGELANGQIKTVISGTRAYSADLQLGVRIYDISDPAQPVLLGAINTPGSARDIDVVGNTMFVSQQEGGFAAYDVSDPSDPQLLDTVTSTPYATTIVGNRAYLGDPYAGLVVVDISDPSNLTVLKTIKTVGAHTLGHPVDVAIKGDYAYVGDWDGAVYVLNIANLDAVSVASKINTHQSLWAVRIVDNRLYTADGAVAVHDIANPATPLFLGAYIAADTWSIDVAGNLVLAACADGLRILDMQNPAGPQVLLFDAVASEPGIPFISGSIAAVPVFAQGVSLLDLSVLMDDMQSITSRGTFTDQNGAIISLSISGGGLILLQTSPADDLVVGFSVINSTRSTSVKISASKPVTVSGLDSGPLKALTLKNVKVDGDVTIGGAVNTLTLGDLSNGTLTVGAAAAGDTKAQLTLKAGHVQGVVMVLNNAVKSLAVTDWTAGGEDRLEAPSIGKLTSAGNFLAAVDLDAVGTTLGLGSAKIAGSLGDQAWTIVSAVGTITAGNADTWTLTAPSLKALTLKDAADVTITVAGAVGKLTALRWLGGDITAASLKTLKISGNAKALLAGDFSADLTLTGPAAATNLGSASVAGRISGGTWNVAGLSGAVTAGSSASAWTSTFGKLKSFTSKASAGFDMTAGTVGTVKVTGNLAAASLTLTQARDVANARLLSLGKLTVTGAVTDTEIRSTGNVGSVTVGSADGSTFYAGVKDTVSGMPAAAADFLDAGASINVFKITGAGSGTYAFDDSFLAAGKLGTVTLLKANTAAATPFGLAAGTMTKFTYKEATTYSWSAKSSAWPSSFGSMHVDHIV